MFQFTDLKIDRKHVIDSMLTYIKDHVSSNRCSFSGGRYVGKKISVGTAKSSRSESSVTKSGRPAKSERKNVTFFSVSQMVVQDIYSVRAAQEFSYKCV